MLLPAAGDYFQLAHLHTFRLWREGNIIIIIMCETVHGHAGWRFLEITHGFYLSARAELVTWQEGNNLLISYFLCYRVI